MSGILYIFLSLIFVAITGLGVMYKVDPEHTDKRFYGKGEKMITRGQAANGIIPIGLVVAIGCAAFGVRRLRGGKKDDTSAE